MKKYKTILLLPITIFYSCWDSTPSATTHNEIPKPDTNLTRDTAVVSEDRAISKDYIPVYPFWGSEYDPAINDQKAVKLRPFVADTLTLRSIETIVNKTWPKVQVHCVNTSGDTLFISIPNSTFLTQQMGTDGAKSFLISTTYSFTELTYVKHVRFMFEEGDHAVPGVYSRDSWGKRKRE